MEKDIDIMLGEEIISLIPFKKEMKIEKLRNEIKKEKLVSQDFIFLHNDILFNKNLQTKFNIDKIIDANNTIKLKLLEAEESSIPPPQSLLMNLLVVHL